MRRFTQLCLALAHTTSSTRKVERMVDYFGGAPADDAALALAYLLGRRGRRPVSVTSLREWACEEAAVPAWLLDACQDAVGDAGETLALLLPDAAPPAPELPTLSAFVRDSVDALAGKRPSDARGIVTAAWRRLTCDERFVYHKLIGGAFRMGVARGLVVRAVSTLTGLDVAVISHRLTGAFQGSAEAWRRLTSAEADEDRAAQPYPFCLATPIVSSSGTVGESLGQVAAWQVERKYDGIRCQLLRREGAVAVVSRGEERIDGSFPELVALARRLPAGTVLDGEVLLVLRADAGGEERPLPFGRLQTRINAKRAAWMAEPGLFDLERIAFVSFDLLERDGADIRKRPLWERRRSLEELADRMRDDVLRLSPTVACATWDDVARERARSAALGVEGLMLKRRDAPYGLGRDRRADWRKWKVDPRTIDAVLVAAQPGAGRRANLLTDYTFALWLGESLVTVAKAYSGLSDAEIALVDRHARSTTVGRKGPVRLLEPLLVFELAFDGLERSTRHKAGIALRFPRILRWRHHKRPSDADHVSALERMLDTRGPGAGPTPSSRS